MLAALKNNDVVDFNPNPATTAFLILNLKQKRPRRLQRCQLGLGDSWLQIKTDIRERWCRGPMLL